MSFSNKFSIQREKLINRLEDAVERYSKTLQTAFENYLIDHIENNFEIIEGSIVQSTKSSLAIRSFDAVKKSFYRKEVIPILRRISRGLIRILIANANYFKEFEENFEENARLRRAEKRLLDDLGIRRVGEKSYIFIKGGWMEEVGRFDKPFMDIKRRAIRAARAGTSLKDFRKQTRDFVRKKAGKLGIIESHFNTHIKDSFAQFDAMVGEEMRKEMGYRVAIYQGGLIRTSRHFCIQRNDKVYTIEEIMAWKDVKFTGKPDNYDPLRDRGGYNCRHFYNWIPEALAVVLRPELKTYFAELRVT